MSLKPLYNLKSLVDSCEAKIEDFKEGDIYQKLSAALVETKDGLLEIANHFNSESLKVVPQALAVDIATSPKRLYDHFAHYFDEVYEESNDGGDADMLPNPRANAYLMWQTCTLVAGYTGYIANSLINGTDAGSLSNIISAAIPIFALSAPAIKVWDYIIEDDSGEAFPAINAALAELSAENDGLS